MAGTTTARAWCRTCRSACRIYDAAVTALIEDLYARGLDRKVMVLAWGEFGRTPRVNRGGRDHWPSSMSAMFAGGGMRMGQVIGSTNARGERPQDRPLHPNDVLATVYRHLGIDHHRASSIPRAGRSRSSPAASRSRN